MISVAIIGILATIAIPAFIDYQNKSRRSEAFSNLAAIARMEKSYYGEFDSYTDTVQSGKYSWPGQGTLGTTQRDWTSASDTAFGALGFRPEGRVYYDYEVNVDTSVCPDRDCFTGTAYGDVDGDGALSAVQYVQRNPDGSGESPAFYYPSLDVPREPVTGRVREQEVAVNEKADDF